MTTKVAAFHTLGAVGPHDFVIVRVFRPFDVGLEA